MLMQRESSGLVLVDVQEKLAPHVLQADALISRCAWLMRLATELDVPILACEQYPKGLGRTVSDLKKYFTYDAIEKVEFSCQKSPIFREQWQRQGKKQCILMGIETHVCVLQTAIEMQQSQDTEVFVVVDAVSARNEFEHKYGLKRMKEAGVQLVTAEMVFFEWLRRAGSDEFKRLSLSFLR